MPEKSEVNLLFFLDPIFYKRINKIDIEKLKDIGNIKEIKFLKNEMQRKLFLLTEISY